MKTKYFVIRKSMCPEKEPNRFHDYYEFDDGTFQIAFSSWLFYTIKPKKKKVIYFSCNPYMPDSWQFTKKIWWKDLYIWFCELQDSIFFWTILPVIVGLVLGLIIVAIIFLFI